MNHYEEWNERLARSEEKSYVLAPTPTWSPQPNEYSSNLDACDDIFQINQQFPFFETNHIMDGAESSYYQNIINHSNLAIQTKIDDEIILHPAICDAADEAKNAIKLSNRESKASEREHNKRIKNSHINNDNLISSIKKEFQALYIADPNLRKLLEKFWNEYKLCPVKIRKKRELRKTSDAPIENGFSCDASLTNNIFYAKPNLCYEMPYNHHQIIPHCTGETSSSINKPVILPNQIVAPRGSHWFLHPHSSNEERFEDCVNFYKFCTMKYFAYPVYHPRTNNG